MMKQNRAVANWCRVVLIRREGRVSSPRCYKFGELWKRIINSMTAFPATLDRLAKADAALLHGHSCKKRGGDAGKKKRQKWRRGNVCARACRALRPLCCKSRISTCAIIGWQNIISSRVIRQRMDFSLGPALLFSSVISFQYPVWRELSIPTECSFPRIDHPTMRGIYTEALVTI